MIVTAFQIVTNKRKLLIIVGDTTTTLKIPKTIAVCEIRMRPMIPEYCAILLSCIVFDMLVPQFGCGWINFWCETLAKDKSNNIV
jgi:hypothetical protein